MPELEPEAIALLAEHLGRGRSFNLPPPSNWRNIIDGLTRVIELFCAGELDSEDLDVLVRLYSAASGALEVGLTERISRLEERLGGAAGAGR